MSRSLRAAVERVVAVDYPNARVYCQRHGDAVYVEIRAIYEAPVVEQIRKALPAADVLIHQHRRTAHGGVAYTLEVRPPVEEAVDGGPCDLSWGGAA